MRRHLAFLEGVAVPPDQRLTLETNKVRRALCSINTRKAIGLGGLPERVLQACSGRQLADVFTNIFNLSLNYAVVPSCLKIRIIVPIPKLKRASCPNNYRPNALTPLIDKFFERLILVHIKHSIPATPDHHQFAY